MKTLEHIELTYGRKVATLVKTLFTGFAVLAVAWISLILIPSTAPSSHATADPQPIVNLRAALPSNNETTTNVTFDALRFGVEFKDTKSNDDIYELDYDKVGKSFALTDKEYISRIVGDYLHPVKNAVKARTQIQNETGFALYYTAKPAAPEDVDVDEDMELIGGLSTGPTIRKDEWIKKDGNNTLVLTEICAEITVKQGIPQLLGGCGDERTKYAWKYARIKKGVPPKLKVTLREAANPLKWDGQPAPESNIANEGLLSSMRWFVGIVAMVLLLSLAGIVGFMKYKERGQIVLVPTHVKMQMEVQDQSSETAAINQFDDRVPTFAN